MIVEVLHPRTRAVRQRLRVASFPFSIGRALDNALVLDDPHVDARHAQLVQDENGSLVAVDLGSVNKLATETHPIAERIRLSSGAEITVGRTLLRFRDESEPVPPAIPLHRGAALPDPALRWHQRTPVRLALCAVALGFVGLESWLSNYARAGATAALTIALGLLFLSLIWAGIWAVAARAVLGQFRFVAHLFISLVATVAVFLLGTLTSWGQFLSPDNRAIEPLSTAVSLALLAAIVAWHLANASTLSASRRWRAGLTTSGVLLLLIGLFALIEDDGFSDVPEFSAVIKSAPMALVPKSSVEEFGAEMRELKARVDLLRESDAK